MDMNIRRILDEIISPMESNTLMVIGYEGKVYEYGDMLCNSDTAAQLCDGASWVELLSSEDAREDKYRQLFSEALVLYEASYPDTEWPPMEYDPVTAPILIIHYDKGEHKAERALLVGIFEDTDKEVLWHLNYAVA